MKTITISKVEYRSLKKLEKLNLKVIKQFANSLKDIKKDRFKKLA